MSENALSQENRPHYAGFWRRFIAALLDQIILAVGKAFIYGALGMIVYAMLFVFDARSHQDNVFRIFAAIMLVADFWLNWIYFARMESSTLHGTLGKLAMGIRVYNSDMQAVTFEQATARYFSKIISALSLCVGFLMAAFSSRKQALHDFIGRTVLVVSRG